MFMCFCSSCSAIVSHILRPRTCGYSALTLGDPPTPRTSLSAEIPWYLMTFTVEFMSVIIWCSNMFWTLIILQSADSYFLQQLPLGKKSTSPTSCSFKTTELIKRLHTGVSKNSGTPNSSILIRFSIINHPFWGTSIFGNTHTTLLKLVWAWQHGISWCFSQL